MIDLTRYAREKEKPKRASRIIAVDFDGVLCKDEWPGIGEPNERLIKSLIQNRKDGDKVILWTCREKKDLDDAIVFCRERGLEFDAVNENIPEAVAKWENDPRKIFANLYIDDKSVKPYW